MKNWKCCSGLVASAAGALLIAGCQAPQQRADIKQIPQITRLVAKATETPQVHRFRKPLRDQRERVLRQLATECERLAVNLRTGHVAVEALTGSVSEKTDGAAAKTTALQAALTDLAAAARSGKPRAIRSSHSAVLSAYTDAQR